MKKIIVIILLILSLLTSLFLFIDSRASPRVNINTSSMTIEITNKVVVTK